MSLVGSLSWTAMFRYWRSDFDWNSCFLTLLLWRKLFDGSLAYIGYCSGVAPLLCIA